MYKIDSILTWIPNNYDLLCAAFMYSKLSGKHSVHLLAWHTVNKP